MTEQPARTPYCHKIRYGVTRAPDTIGMDGSYAPGIAVSPTLVELVYSAARDNKPTGVSASVTGWFVKDGKHVDPESTVTVHFTDGPEGWPDWLAAEARLHDPEPAAVQPPADRAAEVHRLALSEALGLGTGAPWDAIYDRATELGLPPLDRDPVAQRLGLVPAPADRAAIRAEVLNEQGPEDHETLAEAAASYRWLRPVIEATMTDPDRWDGDESEEFHLGRYVQWLAAQAQATVTETQAERLATLTDCHGGALHCEHYQEGDGDCCRCGRANWCPDAGVTAEAQQPTSPETGLATLAAALDGLHTLIATSSRDWGQYRVDAWLWAVLCGWDCEDDHEHDEHCDNGVAMQEMVERHGWDDATVAKARRYRAAVRALTDARQPAGPQPSRGDAFEQWLKTQRDEYGQTTGREWRALDEALDTYRLHADTGTPLGEHVCEGRVVGDCECLEQQAGESS